MTTDEKLKHTLKPIYVLMARTCIHSDTLVLEESRRTIHQSTNRQYTFMIVLTN